MTRKKSNIRTGNILFLLILLGLGLIFLSYQGLDKKLDRWFRTTVLNEDLPPEEVELDRVITEERPDEDYTKEEIEENKQEEIASEEEETADNLDNTQPVWNILSPYGDNLFLNKKHEIQLNIKEGDVNAYIPVVKGKNARLKEIDKTKGKYEIEGLKKGRVELWITTTNEDGKVDVVGTHYFNITDETKLDDNKKTDEKKTAMEDKYLWNMQGLFQDTLWVGKKVPVEVAIAEVDAELLKLEVSSGDAKASMTNRKGMFDVLATKPGKVVLTAKIVEEGRTEVVGSKEFIALKPIVKKAKDLRDNEKPETMTTTNNKEPDAIYLSVENPCNDWLLAGMENPLSLHLPEQDENSYRIKVDKGTIKQQNETYLLNVPETDEIKVQVFKKTKDKGKDSLILTKNYEVRPIVLPMPQIAGKSGGSISVADLKKAKDLALFFPDENYKNVMNLAGFDLLYYNSEKKMSEVIRSQNKGATFSSKTKALFQLLKKGDLIVIDNIEVQVKNQKAKKQLASVAFMVD